MKRLLIFLAGLLITSSAIAQGTLPVPPASQNHTVGGHWTAPENDAGTGLAVNCTSYGGTATSNCVNGYTVTIIPPAGVPGAAPIVTNCANGATTNCLKPGDTGFSWAPGGALYCGNWNYSVVANWLDETGTAVSSLSVTAPAPGVAPCPFVASPVTAVTAPSIT